MNNCVFAGTFDPLTIGHEQIINKCLKKFDKVFIVVGTNPSKTPYLPLEIRLSILKSLYSSNKKIQVKAYCDILDYSAFLKENNIYTYVRGIRNDTDLSYENEYKEKNSLLYPFVKTIFIKANKKYTAISSSSAKEKISKGESLSEILSPTVIKELINFGVIKNN